MEPNRLRFQKCLVGPLSKQQIAMVTGRVSNDLVQNTTYSSEDSVSSSSSDDDKSGMLSSVKKFKLRLIPPPEGSTPTVAPPGDWTVWCGTVFDVLATGSSDGCKFACGPSPLPCNTECQTYCCVHLNVKHPTCTSSKTSTK